MGNNTQFCPYYHHAVELVGRRWTGAIIRALLGGPVRYNEIATGIPDLSDRMLSERLRELEAEGVISRTVIPDAPVRVEYALTKKGRALEAALLSLGKWAQEWVRPEDLKNAPVETRAKHRAGVPRKVKA